mgnify:CR=1 FL=1
MIKTKLKGRVLTEGLRFPEGPVAMADGSVLVVELAGGGTAFDAFGAGVEHAAERGIYCAAAVGQ